MLVEMLDRLDQEHIGFAMPRVRTEAPDELVKTGIVGHLAGGGIYLEADDGVTDFLGRTASAGESG